MNTQDIKDSKNLNAPSKGNVPALRFPEFSGEWKRHKLSEICSFYSGVLLLLQKKNTTMGIFHLYVLENYIRTKQICSYQKMD